MPAMARAVRRLVLLVPAAALLAGCAGPEPAPEPLDIEVALPSEAQSDPRVGAAREDLAAGRYEEARAAFLGLAGGSEDPAQKAELHFFAAEAALGGGDHFGAYDLYRRLTIEAPSAPRHPQVIQRLFLLGRLYAEGRAVKPSRLLGIPLSDREFGVEVLESFVEARERHELADDALHYVAVAREAMGEGELAIEAWQKLGREYPRSEWRETAEYRASLAMVALSDGPEYDKRPLLTGLDRLRTYVDRHPTGRHVAEAREQVARLEEALAGHDLEVARFYLRRDETYSAQVYLTAVQREYPETRAARAASQLASGLPEVAPPPAERPDDELDILDAEELPQEEPLPEVPVD